MTIEGTSPVVSRVAAGWQVRLRELQSAVLQDPTNERAWQWRIQAKVLSFFLSRYGKDPDLDWEEEASALAVQPPHLPFRHFVPPQSPIRIRELLERIADANRHWRN